MESGEDYFFMSDSALVKLVRCWVSEHLEK
jgi:hypothetical protein